MNIQEIIHNQLEAAIAGLSRARDRIADMKPGESQEIGRQIGTASLYLEDIQYNWATLERSSAAKPTSEVL